jgi:hypothetical protein
MLQPARPIVGASKTDQGTARRLETAFLSSVSSSAAIRHAVAQVIARNSTVVVSHASRLGRLFCNTMFAAETRFAQYRMHTRVRAFA